MKARYERTRDVVAIFSATSSESLRLLQFFPVISIRVNSKNLQSKKKERKKERKEKETDSLILNSRLFRNSRSRRTDSAVQPQRSSIHDKSASKKSKGAKRGDIPLEHGIRRRTDNAYRFSFPRSSNQSHRRYPITESSNFGA